VGDTQSETGSGKQFVIARVIEAPRQRVWDALTKAEHLRQWWGPTGFEVIRADVDLRPGGRFHCGMRSIEGFKMWAMFAYHDVVPPERLVFVNWFSNEAGGVTRNPIVPTWPLETITTLQFDEEPDGKTKVSVTWAPHKATEVEQKTFEASPLKKVSWGSSFDQLAAYLAKGS
jgi:uncharacterized protein YndB with AHSA1/START domain